MIDELSIENFKAFGGTHRIPLGPITLIFGGNSSGKTSILQSLLLLRQSVARSERPLFAESRGAELVVRGDLVDLGSFDALVHRHDRELELTLGWSASMGRGFGSKKGPPAGGSSASAALTFRRPLEADEIGHVRSSVGHGAETVFFEGEPLVKPSAKDVGFSKRVGRPDNLLVATAEGTRVLFETAWSSISANSRYDQSARSRMHATPDRAAVLDAMRKARTRVAVSTSAGIPISVERVLTAQGEAIDAKGRGKNQAVLFDDEQLLRDAADVMSEWLLNNGRASRSALGQVGYLGPMRKAPERLHVLTGETVRDAGTRGEYVVDLLARQPRLLRDVNQWFLRLDIPYSLDIKAVTDKSVAGAIGEVHCMLLRDARTGVEVAPTDVGFGIGQVLPVIVQAVLNRRGTLCIEQPEIHLHPALQAELGELFADQIGNGSQFILETHSEHLILRLQRLVRRGKLASRDLVVLHVGSDAGGDVEVRHLRLDDDGEFIDEWPGGFFDERFRELFEDA